MDSAAKSDALREQETLRQMIEDISSELALRPLLTKLLAHACELLRADRGAVGLVDESGQEVRLEALFNLPNLVQGETIALGEGLSGRVLATGQPVILNRYEEMASRRLSHLKDDSVIGLPIFWRQRMIGVFSIGAAPPRRFTENDLSSLELFSRHAAIAIHNAQLFEREKRRAARMEAISKIGRLITSRLSLSDILQTSVEAVSDALAFSSTGIFLVSADNPEELILQARKGPGNFAKVGRYRQALGEGNVGLAAQERRAVHVADAEADPNYLTFPGAERLKSEIALPIIVTDKLLGVLNVESEQHISEEDALGLEIVVDQLGVAIDKAALFGKTESALADMQLLYESSRRISMALDVDSVVEAYLKQVATGRRYRCSVASFELDGAGERKAITLLGRWVPGEGVTTERFSVPYFADAFDAHLDAGETVTMTDVATDPRASPTLKNAQLKNGYPSLALIPLITRSQRTGVISLSVQQAHAWSDADLRPYQVTAAQLATALSSRSQQQKLLEGQQQLAVFEERQRLARDLHDSVSQVIFSMSLVAQTIGEAMRQNPDEGERRVGRLLDLSQRARSEMRALLAELRPSARHSKHLPDKLRVREYGLVKALESLLTDGLDGPKPVLSVEGYTRRSLEVEQTLYFVAKEALTNSRKYAQARAVTLELWQGEGASHLLIRDDGSGFTPATVQERKGKHLGLNTMRERAEALGATFYLHSEVGKGTRVHVSVPLERSTP